MTEATTSESRPAQPARIAHSRKAAPYGMRVVLGVVGLLYFREAGTVTGFLPLTLPALLALIALYVLGNTVLLLRGRLLDVFTADVVTVVFDLVMLLGIVLQDPYPASPVTILLLSTVFDYGQRLAPSVFSGATLLAFCILVFNAVARLYSHVVFYPPEGRWLSVAIGALMINFYLMALAAARARRERRRITAELQTLQQREQEATRMQLRSARLGDSLRFTGLPRREFADRALHCVVAEFGASAAALYERVDEAAGPVLRPLATYAVDPARLRHRRIAMDEGLVGSCAKRQKLIQLHSVPEGYFTLSSGLGEIRPQHIYIVPLSFHGQLAGVLELALVEALPGPDFKLLEQTSEVFAASLLVAGRSGIQPVERERFPRPYPSA